MRISVNECPVGAISSKINNNRVDYIDAAKGIGILLVILGHLLPLFSLPERFIYCFHMPFFFLVSGVFAAPMKYKFSKYLISIVRRLLVPYTAFYFIGLFISLCIPEWRIFSLKDILLGFITTPRIVNMNPIWFLTCLFFVKLFFYPFYNFFLARGYYLIIIIVLLGSVIVSPMITSFFGRHHFLIPFKIDVSLSALPFYCIGFIIRKEILSLNQLHHRVITTIICVIGTLIASYQNGLVAMVNNTYGGDLLVYLFGAFCGISMLLFLGFWLQKSILLKYLGKNSLIIFASHMMCIKLYALVLSRIVHETKTAQNNMSALEIILGFILSVLISIVISYGYEKVKKELTKG